MPAPHVSRGRAGALLTFHPSGVRPEGIAHDPGVWCRTGPASCFGRASLSPPPRDWLCPRSEPEPASESSPAADDMDEESDAYARTPLDSAEEVEAADDEEDNRSQPDEEFNGAGTWKPVDTSRSLGRTYFFFGEAA